MKTICVHVLTHAFKCSISVILYLFCFTFYLIIFSLNMPMKRNTSPIRDGPFLHVHPPSTKKFCDASEEFMHTALSDEKLPRDFHGHSLSKFDEEDDSGIKSGDE